MPAKLTKVRRFSAFRELKLRCSIILLVCALPLAAQAPLDGVWANGELTLRLAGDGAQYSGTIEFQQQTFPTKAVFDGLSLDGSFVSQGDEFFYQGRLEDGVMVFETGGTAYRLARESDKPKSANPLAKKDPAPNAPEPAADTPLQTGAGPYKVDLPEGWTAQPDPEAGVALIPPDAAPDNQEVYAITHLPGMTGPEDPRAAAMLQNMLGAAAMAATYRIEELKAAGRTVILHAFDLPAADRRLYAYLSSSNGQTLAVMASGVNKLVKKREEEILQIAGTAEFVGQAAPPAAARQPVAQPGNIQIHPDAPPIVPGELADGKPQSLQWLARLNGKLLTKMESYSSGASGGYSSRDQTVLFPNGRFQNYTSSNVSADVPGANANSGGQATLTGTWRIVTANGLTFLAVVPDGARQESYLQLSVRNNQTFIDGKRVLVTVPQ